MSASDGPPPRRGPAGPYRRWGKRGADVFGSATLLVLLSPLLAGCALALLAGEGPPLLFRQERVGRGGRPFRILKFRTMRAASGPEITAAGDPRITPLGRRLRRSKLDELPQLWNVLRGEMSLVGPRPEVPSYVRAEPHAFRAVTRVRPGIVDWASLIFRDEETILAARAAEPDFYRRVMLPRKLALARLYAGRSSAGLDLRLLLATFCAVLGAEGPARRLVGTRLYERARRLGG